MRRIIAGDPAETSEGVRAWFGVGVYGGAADRLRHRRGRSRRPVLDPDRQAHAGAQQRRLRRADILHGRRPPAGRARIEDGLDEAPRPRAIAAGAAAASRGARRGDGASRDDHRFDQSGERDRRGGGQSEPCVSRGFGQRPGRRAAGYRGPSPVYGGRDGGQVHPGVPRHVFRARAQGIHGADERLSEAVVVSPPAPLL